MRNALILILFIFCLSGLKLAAKPTDSLRVELRNGIKYIVHRVVKTENLAALAAKYHVTSADIQSSNPLIVTDLKVGQVVLIPLNIDKYGDVAPAKITPANGGVLPIASALPPPQKSSTPVIQQQEVVNAPTQVKLPEDLREKDKLSGKVLRKEIVNADTFAVYQVGMEGSVTEVAKKFNVNDDAIKLYNNLTSIVLVKDQVIRILVSKQASSEATMLAQQPEKKQTQKEQPKQQQEITSQRVIEQQPVITNNEPASTNQLVDATYPYTYTTFNNQKAVQYTTKQGDDLRAIASYFKTSADQIKRINKLTSNKVAAGKTLTIVPSKNFVEPTKTENQQVSTKPADAPVKPQPNAAVDNTKQPIANNTQKPAVKPEPTQKNNTKKTDKNVGSTKKATKETAEPVTELNALNENPMIRVAMINSNMDRIDEDAKKADSWAIEQLKKNTIEVGSTKQNDGVGNKSTTHVVKKGETLLSIARMYGVRTTDIINWNELTNYRVRDGQDLIINQKRYEEDFYSRNSMVTEVPSEIQMVGSIEESGLLYYDHKSKFVGILHESLPVGKMIKIINRDNFLETYARVSGRLPKMDDEKIIIQIDSKVAEKLRVNNPTNKVTLQYAILD